MHFELEWLAFLDRQWDDWTTKFKFTKNIIYKMIQSDCE